MKKLFGPKFSKNGYRFDKRVSIEIVKSILELYTRVTRKCKVTNGQINKSFAQGVIYWLNYDVELDWAKYGVHCNKYVSKLKEMKATNVAREVETGKIRKVKRGLRLPNGKRVKSEHGVVAHGQMQNGNVVQNLNKLEKSNKLLRLEIGPKWHEEEI